MTVSASYAVCFPDWYFFSERFTAHAFLHESVSTKRIAQSSVCSQDRSLKGFLAAANGNQACLMEKLTEKVRRSTITTCWAGVERMN